MWPGRVSDPGPLTYESDALPTALRGPANLKELFKIYFFKTMYRSQITYKITILTVERIDK